MIYIIVAVLVVFVSSFGYFFWYHQDADLTLLFYSKFGREPCSVLGGKVVWITGASSGIGEHLAYELAQCGCKLVLSARRRPQLERVRDKCAEKYPSFDKEKDVLILPLDVTKFSTHTELTSQVIERFGKIDVLVNNAGITQAFLVEEGSFEVEKSLLDLNLLGPISLTKAVLPHMLKRKEGQIVVVSSSLGKLGSPRLAAYAASKFALLGYFGTLRLETSSRNIRVLTTITGPIVTRDGTGNAFTDKLNVETSSHDASEEIKSKIKFLSPRRHAYLMLVAMANNLKETWPATQPFLVYTYMAQYMPSFFMWLQDKTASL